MTHETTPPALHGLLVIIFFIDNNMLSFPEMVKELVFKLFSYISSPQKWICRHHNLYYKVFKTLKLCIFADQSWTVKLKPANVFCKYNYGTPYCSWPMKIASVKTSAMANPREYCALQIGHSTACYNYHHTYFNTEFVWDKCVLYILTMDDRLPSASKKSSELQHFFSCFPSCFANWSALRRSCGLRDRHCFIICSIGWLCPSLRRRLWRRFSSGSLLYSSVDKLSVCWVDFDANNKAKKNVISSKCDGASQYTHELLWLCTFTHNIPNGLCELCR